MNVFNKYILLVSAIKEKRIVTFNYDGLDRVVECATLGYTTAGMPAVRGYQIEGDTHSGTVPCWRLFLIDRIRGLVLTEEHFYSEPPFYKNLTHHSHVSTLSSSFCSAITRAGGKGWLIVYGTIAVVDYLFHCHSLKTKGHSD